MCTDRTGRCNRTPLRWPRRLLRRCRPVRPLLLALGPPPAPQTLLVSPIPSDPEPGGIFVFPRQLVVGDVSVIHPAAAFFAGGAARTPGFAAAARDASKRRTYRQVSSALPFVPMSVKSLGGLGAPALTLL
jgi:hypothetical protein